MYSAYSISDPEKAIAESLSLAKITIVHAGECVPLEIRSSYSHLLATSPVAPSEILGFASFATYVPFCYKPTTPYLRDVLDGVLELWLLRVEPKYFRFGIGTLLLEESKRRAQFQGKRLLLRPQRPGEEIPEGERSKFFPLSTEQLRVFYLSHGFREFTETEIKEAVSSLDVYMPLAHKTPDVEWPPYPEPLYDNSISDKVIKALASTPVVERFKRVQAAVNKRRPLDEYRRECDAALERAYDTAYLLSDNYEYVTAHLIQDI